MKDSGFERANLAPAWKASYSGRGTSGEVTTSDEHTGYSSYHVKLPRTAAAGAKIEQTVQFCPGTTYKLTGWTKRPVPSSGCTATFSIGDTIVATSDNGEHSGRVRTKATYTATSDAEKLSVNIKCGSRAVTYRRDRNRRGMGEMFLDDIKLTTVEPPVAEKIQK